MSHRDVWFVGLLALAYLYLDGAAPAEQRQGIRAAASDGPDADDAADVLRSPTVSDACPRDLSHRISLRADGAIWCLSCDEGFFPAAVVWAG